MTLLIASWLGSTDSLPTIVMNTAHASAVGVNIGDTAPDFKVPTLDGGTFSLSKQRGKPTMVFFMAYWCGTCIPESRALAQLKQEYGDRLSIVAVDVDPSSTPENLTRFKKVAGNGSYTWAFDQEQKLTRLFEVRALDTTLIINSEGQIVYRDNRASSYKTLKAGLKKAGL